MPFNARLYYQRYGSVLLAACESFPRAQRLPNGEYTSETNKVRIRQLKKFLLTYPDNCPQEFQDEKIRTNLARLSLWSDDQDKYTFIGDRAHFRKVQSLDTANPHSFAGILEEPLDQKKIQAIFFVLEHCLVTLPIRIKNPSDGTREQCIKLEQLCQNVEITNTHEHITLF